MDTVDPLRFIFAFLFVIGLIGLSAFALKRYGRKGLLGQSLLGMKAGQGRLAVLELCYLDQRRKLVLVRRDDREHLLLLADGRETVIESWGTAMNDDSMNDER